MKIENYGVGPRCAEVMRRLVVWDTEGGIPEGVGRIILLPIPTARDKIHITGTDRLVSEVLADVGEGDVVVGYGISADDTAYIAAVGAYCFDAAEDEVFLGENAEISALGALGYILTTSDKVPSDLTVGVIGYGRIGSALVRSLLFYGARVRVYTSKELTRVELGECAIDTVYMPRGEEIIPDIDFCDIIINTAPTPLAKSFPTGRVPDGVRVIELASGNNFSGVDGVEKQMSIPDKMYAKSAGRAYFQAIKRYIEGVFV
ncbi:MAG: hypothetical protein IJ515_01355 [Clostridia bacterium]|nr:hypothetical protein [Clostridia bacterium]